MKSVLALLFLSVQILSAACPASTVQITGTLLNPDGSGFTGRLIPFLGYTIPTARENRVTFTATAGVLTASNNGGLLCLAPASYTVANYVGNSQLSYNTYWVVPSSGPVTVSGIESTVIPTPSLFVAPSSITPGTNGQVLTTVLGAAAWAAAAGGGTPASPANAVQYNNAGAFGGSADFTFLSSTSQLFQGGPVPTLTSSATHGEIPLAQPYYKLNAVNTSDFTAETLLSTSDGFAGAQTQTGFIAKAGDVSPKDGTAAVAGTPYLLSSIYTEWNDTTGTDPKLFDVQFSLMPTGNAWAGSYIIASGDGTLGLGKVMASFPGASLQIDSATILLGADDSVTVPSLKSTTGVIYVCIDTTGKLVSQSAACVGTK